MAYTLGTNTTGFSYPGATYWRKGVPTIWDKFVHSVVYDSLVLKPFIGPEGSGLPIIRNTDLKNMKGDTIRLYMEGILTGFGKWGNAALEGYEENLAQYYFDVYVNQIRNAIMDDGEMSRQRDPYDVNSRFSKQLGRWYREQLERYLFNCMYYKYAPHLVGDITTLGGLGLNSEGIVPARYWYCADSTNNSITYSATAATYIAAIQAAEQSLTDVDSDYFGPDVLIGVAALLKTLNVPKVSYKGFNGWIGIISPNQTAQLHANEKWFLANIHAMPSGEDKNPVFSGGMAMDAIGKWGNILLFESNLVHSGNNSYYTDKIATAGGNCAAEIDSDCANVHRALFLGAEAVSFAEAVPPHILKKGDFDYNDKEGCAISGIFGAMRNEYTSDDSNATLESKGVLVVSTYSPTPST